MPSIPHGTRLKYAKDRCRCDKCRTANTDYKRKLREIHRRLPLPVNVQHGTLTTYAEYGCNCFECRRASAKRRKQQRERAKCLT